MGVLMMGVFCSVAWAGSSGGGFTNIGLTGSGGKTLTDIWDLLDAAPTASGTQSVTAESWPLPVGAATSANQAVANSSLAAIASNTVGAATNSGITGVSSKTLTDLWNLLNSPPTQAVSGTFWQTTQPVSAASLPLPSGAATSANQTTGNSSLSSIDGKLPSLSNGRVPMDGSGVTQPVSASSLPLPSGAATSANQTTANSSLATIATNTGNGATNAGIIGPSSKTLTDLWNILNSPPTQAVSGTFWQTTQPVSAASLPLPSGAATSANQATANSSLATIATNTGNGATNAGITGPSSKTLTDLWNLLNSPPTQAVSGTFWQTTQPISAASLPLPSGAATSANQATANSSLATIATNTGNAATNAGITGTGSKTLTDLFNAFSGGSSSSGSVSVLNWPTTQAVSGTFWQATQPVSAASLPLPTGASTSDNQAAQAALLSQLHTDLISPLPPTVTQDTKDAGTDLNQWTITAQGSGDIIRTDGNAVGQSYIVISRDPLVAGTDCTLESTQTFKAPFQGDFGLSMSQRVLGSEFSIEYVSTETSQTAYAPVAISTMTQATTTLTVTTTGSHGLFPGDSVCIYGSTDPRINYPAITVASIPAYNQFTVTAGPGGTITSQNVGPITSGQVSKRQRIGNSPNGTSMIFDNTTVTNASFYVAGNDTTALPSGTIIGSHAATISTTAPVQNINAAYTYAFGPSSNYRILVNSNEVCWYDHAIDGNGAWTSRCQREQSTPDTTKTYKMRIRGTVEPSYTIPTAQIVSASKAGSTTATITTDRSHGLTTSDWIVVYGIRDTANFANQATAVAVASVTGSNTFTVVFGASATATSYGGYIARVQGGNLMSACGASAITAASVTRTSNIVTLTSASTWTGAVIGDYVNLIGIRDNSTGASLGVDGPYVVQNLATTTLTLAPIGNAPTGADIGSTNCGGTFIKRTDLRLHKNNITAYSRILTENVGGNNTPDQAHMQSVYIANTVNIAANSSVNAAQVGGSTPNTNTTQGSTNKSLGVITSGVSNSTVTTTAFGGGRVLGATQAVADGGGVSASFDISLTTWTAGSSTGIQFFVEQSSDNGTTWSTNGYSTEPVNATGHIYIPPVYLQGRWRIASNSFTANSTTATTAINVMESSVVPPVLIKSYTDVYASTNPTTTLINGATSTSTLVSTTLNSAGAVVNIEGCKLISISVLTTGGTPTTNPIYTLYVGDDMTNMIATNCTVSPTGAGTFGAVMANSCWRYAKLQVTTASAGGTPFGVSWTRIKGM